MAELLNYAEEYSRALANAYPNQLHFAALRSTENNNKYKWIDAKTIKIPHLSVGGRTDGTRDAIGSFTRNFDNDWETKELKWYRTWQTLVDPKDIDETNQVASIANITQEMNEREKFPEMDSYLSSKLYADWTEAGGKEVSDAPTTDTILEIFDEAMVHMDEKRVPAVGRILYVTPAIEKILKSAEGIARNILLTNNDGRIARLISNIDSVAIEKVPSDLMLTAYDFTVGYKAGASAKQINMFLSHPSCVITPEKYTFAGLGAPSAVTQGKYVYYEESYGDVFVLDKRYDGLFFCTSARTQEDA